MIPTQEHPQEYPDGRTDFSADEPGEPILRRYEERPAEATTGPPGEEVTSRPQQIRIAPYPPLVRVQPPIAASFAEAHRDLVGAAAIGAWIAPCVGCATALLAYSVSDVSAGVALLIGVAAGLLVWLAGAWLYRGAARADEANPSAYRALLAQLDSIVSQLDPEPQFDHLPDDERQPYEEATHEAKRHAAALAHDLGSSAFQDESRR